MLRTGTDNTPFHVPALNTAGASGSPMASLGGGAGAAPGSMGMAQPDYHDMKRPSVWRQRDRTQAAAKVDALSSGGMEDFEIPAFLRKQAD